ncbi:hypothetical protein ACOSQ3_032444 [Xanthoceras sorbifolium]
MLRLRPPFNLLTHFQVVANLLTQQTAFQKTYRSVEVHSNSTTLYKSEKRISIAVNKFLDS